MMSSYDLRIRCQDHSILVKVSGILKIYPKTNLSTTWLLRVDNHENDKPFDFINKFLDILDGKYEQLESIGINRDQITIWYLYEYDEQCDMEFFPEEMKRLGDNGIKLCISCWSTM